MTFKKSGGELKGPMTFKAPTAPGSYDVRMFDTDSKGNEIASAAFTVK